MNNKVSTLQKKLNLLGINMKANVFVTFKIISSLVLFIILLFISKVGYLLAPIITVIYYVLVEYIFIDLEIYKRSLRLEYDALEFFPVFLLSLNGGRNIKKAIILSTSIVNNSLSKEFEKVLNDINIGKSLEEALLLLEDRIPSEIINNIILNIREANRFGNSISDSVNRHLELIEEKYQKNVIKNYKYVPLKLTIVSISFVFIMISFLIFITYFI